jgi:hypothetical protein
MRGLGSGADTLTRTFSPEVTMVDTSYRAHQAIRNLSTHLAANGALPGFAARQMCDGFVSRANLLQAQQAMIDARNAGDGTAYSQAAYLHQALGVALEFQDAHATAIEGRKDATETLRAHETFVDVGMVSDDRLLRRRPRDDDEPGLGTVLVAGVLLASAVALMSNGQRDDHHRVSRRRGHR